MGKASKPNGLGFAELRIPKLYCQKGALSARTLRLSTSRRHSNLFPLVAKEEVKGNNQVYKYS